MDDVKNVFVEEKRSWNNDMKALKNAVVALTADVDTLYRLVDDLMEQNNAPDPVVTKPNSWRERSLSERDLSRVREFLGVWGTLEMIEVWIGSKSRKGARCFIDRVRVCSPDYDVISRKLPNTRAKMFCIVERKAEAA